MVKLSENELKIYNDHLSTYRCLSFIYKGM